MTRNRVVGLLLMSSLVFASPLASGQEEEERRRLPARRRSTLRRPAVEGARARVQAVRRRGLLLGLDRAQQGDRGRVGRQRAEQAEGRVLDGQGPLQPEVLLGVAVVLRSHRQKGPSHAYYNATLKWLASLSRQLPDSTGILEKIGKYNRAELDQPALEKVRDELYFLLGKFYYQKGSFKEAVELFDSGADASEFYVQAKLFEGATHVREYQAKPAVESFKEVLRAAAESTDPKHQAVRGPREPVARAHLLLDRPVRAGDQVLRPRLAGVLRLGEQPVRVVVGELHAQAEGLLEGARQHPHHPGAVLRELHQARVGGRGADGQGDDLLLQLPLRPRAGGDRRVQRHLPDGVHRAEEADRRPPTTTTSCSRWPSRFARRRRACPSRSSAPRAASSAT